MTKAEERRRMLANSINTTTSSQPTVNTETKAERRRKMLQATMQENTKIEPLKPSLNQTAVANVLNTTTGNDYQDMVNTISTRNAINATAKNANPTIANEKQTLATRFFEGTTDKEKETMKKIEQYAKDNNLKLKGVTNKQKVLSLYEQTKNTDKQVDMEDLISSYNQNRIASLSNKSYLGENAKASLIQGISGPIDYALGTVNNVVARPNQVLKSANEALLKSKDQINTIRKRLGKEELSTQQEEIKRKYEEQEKKSTESAKELLKYNVLGEIGEDKKQDVQDIIKLQNVNGVEKVVGDVVGGIAGMAPTILLSYATKNPQLALTVMSSGAGGTAYREAINEGYEQSNAFNYATLMALKEYATEKMFGTINRMAGFDIKGYGDELSESIINQIFKENGNKILRGFAEYILGGVEEGLEEFVGDLIEPYIKNLTLGTKEESDLKSALYSGLVGAMTGLAMGAPSGAINLVNDIKTNQSTIQNSTQLQQNTQNTSNNVQNISNNEKLPQNASNNVLELPQNATNTVQGKVITPTNKNQNLIPNNSNMQNTSNNVQTSQNDVQNVSNLENTIQNDTERFSQEVEEWKNNKWNKDKNLTVLEHTPQLYLDMGINDLPITVTASKLERIYFGEGKQKGRYHNLQELVKQIPEAITRPLNIVESSTKDGSIVIVTDLSDSNGDIVIVSLALDGKGRIEIEDVVKNVDANAMTSAYGRKNYDYNIDNQGNYYDGWMEDNLRNGRIVYDVDEGIIKKRINGQWLELPNDTDSSNTSVKRLQLPSDTGISDVSSTTNTPINNIIRPSQNYVNNQNFAFPTNEQLQSTDNKKISDSEQNTTLPQNTSNNVQNISNNEKLPQNASNNVSELPQNANNQQMSISDEQDRPATVTNEIQTFVENRNKIAPGLNVEMDNTLKTDGVIIKNSDGTRTMKINPNSTRAYEFVAVHEMLHDLEGTQEYLELQKYVQDRANSHGNYEQAKQAITTQYENFYKANGLDMSNLDMNIETVNDMVAQSLGNQQFLNELAGNKPNVFMRMYNWVKNVLFDGQNTGKTFNERRTNNKYLQELKKKFERAYNTAYKSSAGEMYDIITTKDNKRFVKASRQVIQGNDVSNWGKQIKKYINEEIRKGQDVSVYGEDGTLLSITADTAGKATFRNEVRMSDGTTRFLTDNEYKSKLEAESHVDELAQVSKHKNGPVPDTKNHSFAKDGFNYRTAYFEDSDGKYYKITISVGKNGAINTIYNVGQMKEMQKNRSGTSNRGLKGPNGKTANGSTTSKYSIPSSDSTVNNQYMQNNEKNSQGLEDSSSFLMQKDNQDTRYSQPNNEWSKYLKENWDLMPNSQKTFGFPTNEQLQTMDNKKISESADTLNLREKKIKSLEEIANMTENDARMENGVNYKHKKDKNTSNERSFFENVKTSKTINQDVKDTIEMTTYEKQSNEETLARAMMKLDEQGDKLIKQWEYKTKNFTAEDVAVGAILIERYQQNGDIESAVNVVQKLADMGTEVGQAVQMYSIFQRLTPEAMMVYQQRKLNGVFKEMSQRKTGEWVEANKDKFTLTSDDSKFITEQVEKAQQATSERQKQIELAKIESRINDKLPPNRGQTIKAIRRISMLFNPKTQVRNIVGNTLIMPVNDVADIIGTQIDKAIAKRTGVRTTNNPIFKEKGKGFKKGITESIQDYKMGIRTEPSGSKYEFNFGGKSFNENTSSKALNVINNKLNGIENLLGAVMSGGDRPFYEAAFNNSLQGQMKANNVTTPTTEMIDIAVNEALSRTWNDNNSYTEAVLGIRRQMNKLNVGGFGLGDLIIPFAKTPANLTKAIVEYSPLGAVKSIMDYSDMKKAISRGEMTAQQQKNFVNSTSKAIAGSILYLITGALVQSGAMTGSSDDDKDVKNFEQNVLGIQPYSIKIGDKTFTYSWANPLNTPLAIMADTYKMSKEKAGLFDILTNGFKVAGEVVVDNSFLQGIKELFEADSISEGIVNAIVDMPAQFIPTFLSQFATLGDKTKRQTFEYGDKLESTMNQIKSKIPGVKNTLAPTVNTFGEEVKNYGGDNSVFNVFLNPANISKANATDTQKELYALYEVTKDKTIFPMQAPYYLSDDGEKVNLSSDERAEYQKRSGEYVSKELHALFDSEFYKNLENKEKVKIVNKIVKDANNYAKSKWVTTDDTKELKKIKDELKDIPMVDYYNAWLAQKGAEGKKNAFGKTISGTNKKAKIKAINEAVDDELTTQQKKILYGIFNLD